MFSHERYSKIHTFIVSAPDAPSEVQNAPKRLPKTPPEHPKTLPRVPREVPGASPRRPRSTQRRLQRRFSSAWGLRGSSEVASGAFWLQFCLQFGAPSLFFFLFHCLLSMLSLSLSLSFSVSSLTFLSPLLSTISPPFLALSHDSLRSLLLLVPLSGAFTDNRGANWMD